MLGSGQLVAQVADTGRDLGAQLGGVLAALQLCQRQLQLLLIQHGIGGHGTGAQHGGQLVAGHAQTGAQLVNFAQVLVQADGSGGRDPDIHRKDKKQHNVKDQHDLERHRIGAAGQQGMKDLDHQYTAQPPQQGELRADIAAQIEFHVGVIPPADVVDLEQRPAADQLNGGGQRHADEKDGHGAQAAAVRQWNQVDTVDQPHHAEAVDRADWPAEKAAVDECMGLDGGVDDLNAPADESVQEEPIQCLNSKFNRRHLPPPAAWPAPWARPRSRCCRGPCGQSAP